MSVPLAVSPGRAGFGPQLALSYDSGAGNGPFGWSWSLSLPSIIRKTDKGLPTYQDADESDVFILSGSEDLVPVLQPDATRFKDDTTAPGFTVHRYRPRIQGPCTQLIVQDTVQEVDAESLENLPVGLDSATYQWTALHGEGIHGLLTEQSGAWFYKRNLSPINVQSDDGVPHTAAKFAPVELVAAQPNLALAGGQAQFIDLAGAGQPDLVVLDGPTPGLYEHDGEESWQPFHPFTARLNRDTRDSNLKLVDLDGDGHADVLITYVGFFQFLRNFRQQNAFEQAGLILRAALDPVIASRAKRGEFVTFFDHFDLLQTAKSVHIRSVT
jgi:hypothetical protein